MKKMYHLKLCMIFALLFIAGAVFWGADTVKADAYGKWDYSKSNNQVTITKYNGADPSVYIPDSINGMPVTALGYRCFRGNTYLQEVEIPETVTVIGDASFENCTELARINGMKNVTRIGDHAFAECTKLPEITLGDKVTSLGYECFLNCSSLTKCNLPDSLETLGGYCFGNSAVVEMNIPASVSVDYSAFENCTSLTSVTIGKDVYIPYRMFYGCTSLKTVTIAEAGITSIGEAAFEGCTALEEISLPSSIRSIDSYAFQGCISLVKVELAYNLLEIGSYAFCEDPNLSDIKLPNSVLTIDSYAFTDCPSIGTILIPSSVTKMGYRCMNNAGMKIQYYPGSVAAQYVLDNSDVVTGEELMPISSTDLEIAEGAAVIEVEMGALTRIPYTMMPADTTDAVVWKSSSEAVAAVNGAGEVIGKKIGETTIIATTTSGLERRVDVKVIDRPDIIYLSDSRSAVRIGGTAALQSTVYNTSNKVITDCEIVYTSSDPTVAAVSAAGVVTGLKTGTSTITATVKGRDISASCLVTVVTNQPVSISMSTYNMSLRAGNSSTRTATIRDGLGIRTDLKPSYTSSNPAAATVDANGKVTAINAGTATITASIGNLKTSYTVTVTGTSNTVNPPAGGSQTGTTNPPGSGNQNSTANRPVSVSFVKTTTATILVGKTTTRKATVSGSTVKPAYTSSNKKIAKVSASGKVTGLKAGTVTITARAGNYSASYKVTVVMAKLSRSGKTLTITTLPKAKVTVKASKSILGKSSKKATANKKGIAKVKFKKKIKGTVKVTIAKSGYKKKTITKKF